MPFTQAILPRNGTLGVKLSINAGSIKKSNQIKQIFIIREIYNTFDR